MPQRRVLGPHDREGRPAGKPNVRREKTNTISITGVKARPSTEVVVMNYK